MATAAELPQSEELACNLEVRRRTGRGTRQYSRDGRWKAERNRERNRGSGCREREEKRRRARARCSWLPHSGALAWLSLCVRRRVVLGGAAAAAARLPSKAPPGSIPLRRTRSFLDLRRVCISTAPEIPIIHSLSSRAASACPYPAAHVVETEPALAGALSVPYLHLSSPCAYCHGAADSCLLLCLSASINSQAWLLLYWFDSAPSSPPEAAQWPGPWRSWPY